MNYTVKRPIKVVPKSKIFGKKASFSAKNAPKGSVPDDDSSVEESEEVIVTKKLKTGPAASFAAKKKKVVSDSDSSTESSSESESESEREKVSKPKRPNFKGKVKSIGIDGFNHATGHSVSHSQNLTDFNAAVPHRMDWSSLRDNTMKYVNGEEEEEDFLRWTDRFLTASKKKINLFRTSLDKIDAKIKSRAKRKAKVNPKVKPKIKPKHKERKERIERLIKAYKKDNEDLKEHRDALIEAVEDNSSTLMDRQNAMDKFLNTLNSFHANVPDIGPHNGVNLQVSNRPHLNVAADGSMSPMSQQLGNMSPGRLNPFPFSHDGRSVMTTSGTFVDYGFVINQYGTFAPQFKNKKKMKNLTEKTFDKDNGFEDKMSENEEDD
ncbi:hypothetical protein [Spirosoma radiotolerans]|uniref:Uncharacterized protein n=1 Tax=Spirosoma radiotolerans TaxID=1379870 RepID=A0A0E3V6U5_9BACT|nr:hypothetical protein [Spirosoma radiotolerans]AKD55327.1 hypothetical protein SD10_10865 [Spirosoma radiotolerans]